jgi:hypothetical protein
MKIAFLSEMNFEGKIPSNHPNMRTEFAWMYALDAIHHSLYNFDNVMHNIINYKNVGKKLD